MRKTVARTCTELSADRSQASDAQSRPLADFRTMHAYVLLGDPGSGKTTAFQAESEALGDDALFITARNFLLHTTAPSRLRGKTLFIDGLDEVRAGKPDARSPFDEIRRLLIQLEKPRFRISCREADWLGENDRQGLAYVVPEATVAVLRLEALTREDILAILRDSLGVREPQDFVVRARQAGLEGLLGNPQALELLARAVKQGISWPESRVEVFDLACRQIAGERNREHQIVNRNIRSTESLIDSAGRLCALLLISDKAGCCLDGFASGGDYLGLDPCGQEDPENLRGLRAAVSSKLFSADSKGCFGPVHRQIAEFLGAKHLAKLVANGLSPLRVLSLITGGDGVAVTALRGLSGWLATHSTIVRSELISKNPVDLAIYGDLSAFPSDDKAQVLEALLAQPMSLKRAFFNITRFSPLATADSESQILRVLRCEDRDTKQEIRVRFLSLLLSVGERLPGLADVMAGIVRDSSWPSLVRQTALDAFVHYQQGLPKGGEELKAMLEEFRSEGISIANRELCGTLLCALYPTCVGPKQVWSYLTHLSGASSWDRYIKFWHRDLLAQSTASGIAELLDTLASSVSRLEVTIDALRLWDLPLELVQRALRRHGERAPLDRVSAWLRTCAGATERRKSNPPASLLEIRAWLESHPEVQKQVVLKGLEACQDGENLDHADYYNRKRLVGAKLPADFGLWCLSEAVRLACTKPAVAKHLFLEAHRALTTPGVGEGLSPVILQDRAHTHPLLEGILEQLQARTRVPQQEERWRQQHAAYAVECEQQREMLLANVRSHKGRLVNNRARPDLLYQLALVYFGEVPGVGAGMHGEEAITQALGDPCAVGAALHGLRHCVDRDDLPSAREVIRLAKNSREHYISLPLMAGLRELQKSTPGLLRELDEGSLRTCVACLHCWEPPFLGDEEANPDWYRTLLDHRPQIVSDVAVQCAAGALRRGGMISPRFWDIVNGHEGGPAALSAVLRLLRALPTRCNARQIEALDELLWTGLRSGWRSDLLDLARKRLSRRGIDAGQRVRWMGLGLICDPEEYKETLAQSVGGKESLVRHLARFFVHDDRSFAESGVEHTFPGDLDPLTAALIVRLLGRFFAPREPLGFVVVSDELRVSWFVQRVIDTLGSRPSKTASRSLESLLGNRELSSWRTPLSIARAAQCTLRRDAEFRHPTLLQACETLRGGGPANACDLAALTVDALRGIARRIRTSNSNEWRQYWNEGRYGVPLKPKVEETCRDALLAAVRPMLPESVRVEPEGRQVNGTRADLVVTAEKFKIPVEAKKNGHDGLWSGIENQLVAKYTLDPATGGYGIYLVFWFGAEHQRQRADGARPKEPQELEDLLRNSLSEDQARKVQVCVIDVSRPVGPGRDGIRTIGSKG